MTEIERLKERIQDERSNIARVRQAMAADAGAYREQHAAARTELFETRARIEKFLTSNPRLAHLTPFRQAFSLYSRSAALGEAICADAYIAHDDIPLLAAGMLADRFGGKIVYDAAEFPDRRERFGQFQLLWPRPGIELVATFLAPLIRSCAFALTGGEPIADHIRGTFQIPCHTIYNTRRFIYDGVDPGIREQCGLGPHDILMLYVNTVSRASLFENLIEGMAAVDSRYHLAVLGKITPPELEPQLLELARRCEVQRRLHFLGVVEHDAMPQIASGADYAIVAVDPRLKNCRMFVHNRYFDALAAGLPIMGSVNVGAQLVFGEEPFYREFNLLDPRDFAATVAEAGPKVVDRERIRSFARARTWDTEVPKIRQLFDFAKTVTILTVKDVAQHQRTIGFAEALGNAGIHVNVVCRRIAQTAPELENVRWFRQEHLY